MRTKSKGFFIVICAVFVMLTGCDNDYIVKPSGTNENAVHGTFNVPERYKKVETYDNGALSEQVESTASAKLANEEETAALSRKSAFEDILNTADLKISLMRMRSYGESSELARMTCVYEADKVYYVMYNANDELVQEVIGDGDTAWLVDRDASKKLETERDTYKYCDIQTLRDMFILNDIDYVITYTDTVEEKTLLCDEYVSDSETIRYYYDTAGNLILLRETTDSDEVTTLFSELTTLISEDFWDAVSVDFTIEKLIK